jgi:uncharacterized membrane protein YkoI
MKKLTSLFLILCLLVVFAGCRSVHMAEEYIDHKLDVAEDRAEQAFRDAVSPTVSSIENITEDQAQAIALEHAGLTEADISHLQVRKDFDDGRQEYDVEFHVDRLEYEYEIDAATGKILSFDKDL